MSSGWDRREVLRRLGQAGLVVAGAGALGAAGLFSRGRWKGAVAPRPVPDRRVPDDPSRPLIASVHGPDPATLVRAAVGALGGIERFIRPGETVLLKPNMAWDRAPEQGANTHPAVVAEMVRLCRQARAGRVIVADVPVHDAARVAERSGIRRAALEAGAELVLPSGTHFVLAALSGDVLDRWEVLGPLFEAERLINLPVAKDHALTGLTCGMKNWYGLLGGTRARLHQEIHSCIADLALAIRPTLTVVDATRVMVRGGPTGGRLEDVVATNAVAAATDAVAADAWAARQLSRDPADIGHIVTAAERGLGSIRPDASRVQEIHAGA